MSGIPHIARTGPTAGAARRRNALLVAALLAMVVLDGSALQPTPSQAADPRPADAVPAGPMEMTTAAQVGAIGTVLGRPIRDSQGEEVGQLVDIMVNARGRPVAAILEVGGFMGVGARRIAVGWSLLHLTTENNETRIFVHLKVEDLAAAPEFRGMDGAQILIGRQGP